MAPFCRASVTFPASFGLENTQHVNQFKAGLNWHIAPNIW